MFKSLPRSITRFFVAIIFVFAASFAVLAQTPSPTPVNPATLPPGQQVSPATAPPGTQPAPTPVATPITPAIQEPNFPVNQPQALPPLPDLTRVGVLSSNNMPLSMNDAIRTALQNNNDIEVARDEVRFAETQLRGLYGVFDPVFNMTPQFVRTVSPQQSTLGGGGASGTTSTTTFNFSPQLSKQFSTGGGFYTFGFANSRTSSSSTFNTLSPFWSSNLSLQFNQPLWRNRSIDANRHAIRVQKKRLEQ